ncbi:MAG: response regulator transcription factor [Dokdonella sp.]
MIGPVKTALVVDDLAASREWLSAALKLAFSGVVITTADSIARAQKTIAAPPQLALIDLGLPDGSGVRLIEQLHPLGCCCIVATVFDDDAHLFPALRAGAQGYVLKDQSQEQLAAMLRGIGNGEPALSPSIARRLLRHFQPVLPTQQPASSGVLTSREADVLRLIAKGHTVAEVARLLELSAHTVSGYLKDVYRKLSVNNRAEAALEAVRLGLVGDN